MPHDVEIDVLSPSNIVGGLAVPTSSPNRSKATSNRTRRLQENYTAAAAEADRQARLQSPLSRTSHQIEQDILADPRFAPEASRKRGKKARLVPLSKDLSSFKKPRTPKLLVYYQVAKAKILHQREEAAAQAKELPQLDIPTCLPAESPVTKERG